MPADAKRWPRPEAARGFTLIEVLVVLVILGLAVALIVSRGPARSRGFDLRATAGEIAEQLRLARSEAITTDRTAAFALDPKHRRYLTDGVEGASLPPDVALMMTTATGGAPRPIDKITFEPDGSSSGGRVVVADSAHAEQIVVDWLTGRVSVTDAS